MNHDSPPTPPPPSSSPPPDAELEARIVAWLAGELSAPEIADLEKRVAAQPALTDFKRRIEAVHSLVAAAERPETEPLRLSAERRAQLLRTLDTPAVAAPLDERIAALPKLPSPWSWRAPRIYFTMASLAAACLVVLLTWQHQQPVRYKAVATMQVMKADNVIQTQGVMDNSIRSDADINTFVKILESGTKKDEYMVLPVPPPRPPERKGQPYTADDFKASAPTTAPVELIAAAEAPAGNKKSSLFLEEIAKRPITEITAGKPQGLDVTSPDKAILTWPKFGDVGGSTPGSLALGGKVYAQNPNGIVLGQETQLNTGGSSSSTITIPTAFIGAAGTVALSDSAKDHRLAANSPSMHFGAPAPSSITLGADTSTLSKQKNERTRGAATYLEAGTANLSEIAPASVEGRGLPTVAVVEVGTLNFSGLAPTSVNGRSALTVTSTGGTLAPATGLPTSDKEKTSVAGTGTLTFSSLPPSDPTQDFSRVTGGISPVAGAGAGATAVASPAPVRSDDVVKLSAFMVAAPEKNESAAPALAAPTPAPSLATPTSRSPDRDDPRPATRAKASPPPAPPTPTETTTAQEPVSTFSLHVSDVSFRLAQAALARGEAPDPARIRPEEFYNAFDYGDPAPATAEKIGARVEQSAHPFLQQRNLVRIALKVPATGRGTGTPLHLTVLLDTSGSMEREDRAASVRRALEVLVSLLGANDRLTLIGFARQPHLLAENLPGPAARQILDLVKRTPSEGGTNLEEALKLGGELALRHRDPRAQNRLVLLTDGAANLGDSDPARLATAIATLRQQGIAFDACGVGLNGLDDEILEALTRQGDGRYYALNSPADADTGFAQKLAGAFRPAAENVKVQVRFNPARVGRYRLIGFEQHRLREEDFRNDQVDAAELAAEEAAVALYQVEVLPQGEGELGEVFVRFRDAATGTMVERSWSLAYDATARAFDRASPRLQLAGTAALLAEKLRGGPAAAPIKLRDLVPIANTLRGHYAQDARVQQLVTMLAQSRRLFGD